MPEIDFPLYLVTDRSQTVGRPLMPLIQTALDTGLRAIQLREKDLDTPSLIALSDDLHALVRKVGGQFFLNDRIDLVLALGTSGAHLPASGLPVRVARKLLGPNRMLGASTHSVEEVRRAESEGADFVVLGPVYETSSKRDYGNPIGLQTIEEAARKCRIPVLAIGGVTVSRVQEVRRAGAFGVAVISAILAADDVARATRALLEAVRAPL